MAVTVVHDATIVTADDAGTIHYGAALVVDGGRGEILIPLAADICVQIDPQTARIVVSPPEGLIELNAPRSERL